MDMEEEVKLHLGCGSTYRPGFVNVDINAKGATDVLGDALRLPFREEAVGRIEAFQVIEHFDLVHCRYLLAEWFRVLAEGGVLIVETPDFERTLRKFVKSDPASQRATIQWMFGIDSPGLAHKTGFTRELMADTLKEAGFVDVRWRRQETHRYEEGIRVECIRGRSGTRARLSSWLRTRIMSSCSDLDSHTLIPMERAISRVLESVPENGTIGMDTVLRATAILVVRNPCIASAFVTALGDLSPALERQLSGLSSSVNAMRDARIHQRAFAAWISSRKEPPLDSLFDRFMETIENDIMYSLANGEAGPEAQSYLMSREPVEIAALTSELVKSQSARHLGVGTKELSSGRLDSAKEHLDLAARIDPTNLHAHWSLGRALAASGDDLGLASEAFSKALSVAGNEADRRAIEGELGNVEKGRLDSVPRSPTVR
jgi:predicted SAM-dependent methyltransferase